MAKPVKKESPLLLKLARNLRAGFLKDTKGEPEPWAEASDEDRRLWIRCAKRALRLTGAQPASASSSSVEPVESDYDSH